MKFLKVTVTDAFHVGRLCSRTQASVITPSVPSEPRTILSAEGPAPDPGSRRVSITPDGVTNLVDSTKSSMCVKTEAKCPPARVATQPPSVENLKL